MAYRRAKLMTSRSAAVYFVFGFVCSSILFLINSTFVTPSASVHKSILTHEAIREYAQRMELTKNDKENDDDDDVPVHEDEAKHGHDHDDDHVQNIGMFRHKHVESQVATALKENVKVLCWIMTAKKNTQKAITVNATWAPRCNKYVFVTANETSNLPSVELPDVQEGREYLWAKTKAAFKWIYDNEVDNYDWFLKADDDTYVVMENLRFMLLAYDPDAPLYFGCKFKPFTRQGYMSGGSGYVLSREAVKRFVRDAMPDSSKCKQTGTGAEDAEIGKCLQNVEVIAGDSRDSEGRHRMLPFSPLTHLQEGGNKTVPEWFHKYMFYPYVQGEECCSDYMISFHYVNKGTMYALDNLLYHIRPIGFMDEYWMSHLQQSPDSKSVIETLTDLATKTSQPVKPNEISPNNYKGEKKTDKKDEKSDKNEEKKEENSDKKDEKPKSP